MMIQEPGEFDCLPETALQILPVKVYFSPGLYCSSFRGMESEH